jgi:hypothetical protein
MKNIIRSLIILMTIMSISIAAEFSKDNIPLPEHPRPDFQREEWINLNGPWNFKFDSEDVGETQKWYSGDSEYEKEIMVPFSWGSKLSGVNDEADIAWYKRSIKVPSDWKNNRIALVIGACDWHTKVWLDGKFLGEHKGGYTPFEFDLTEHVVAGKDHSLVLRVDDTPYPFKLYGKQGYGRAAGIWQTIYLEARPENSIQYIHFTPDIDNDLVKVNLALNEAASENLSLQMNLELQKIGKSIKVGENTLEFDVKLDNPRLWSLDDPFLYNTEVKITDSNGNTDKVSTYFGMRKISVVNLPGTEYPYVALNGIPVYLQMTLDQAYHPDGYYTFPSDEFMRDEILRTRRIGLNGQRIHIKAEIPRKLYWADRLGVLIMADVPNFWGEPGPEARAESEYCLTEMIKRDYNHPSIFSWVNFNETWGLRTEGKGYTKETQEWVKSVYHLTKKLDSTRLVEDNSTNRRDHVVTDLNTWHAYLPGDRWNDVLELYSNSTYQGSPFNFVEGYTQDRQPMMNSECGNVWGYEKDGIGYATGDVDWSWDYHQMINAFRKFPKCAGWLYTEHHDVINEWNGYYKYDRSKKYTGIEELVPGMSLNDLHAPIYIVVGDKLSREVSNGEEIVVPLYISAFTDAYNGDIFEFSFELFGWNSLGQQKNFFEKNGQFEFEAWMQNKLTDIRFIAPDERCVAILAVTLKNSFGNVLHKNFMTFIVNKDQDAGSDITRLSFDPQSFSDAKWSRKQWNVLDGMKVNGAGFGFFEYTIPWPEDLKVEDINRAELIMELSAKKLHAKDYEGATTGEGDFMQGKGTSDPSQSPNSYPMTDENVFPSAVKIMISDISMGNFDLEDDPADHRGILSWHNQPNDYIKPENPKSFQDFQGGFLHEAGSYGYLVSVSITKNALNRAATEGKIKIRLEVDDSLPGGLAIYGDKFGRYPLNPTIVFKMK